MPQLQDVLAGLAQGVLVESEDGQVVWVNQAWCDLLGVAGPAPGWAGADVGALLGSADALPDLAGFLAGGRELRSGTTAATHNEWRLRDGRPVRRTALVSDSGVVWLLEPPVPPPADTRVLVVDDNLVNRSLLEGMLQVLGCACDTAKDGQEALDALAARSYAVVLMDVAMPVLDGHAATRALRAREGGRRTPVLALTAAGSAEDRRRSLEAGMDDFLVKPLSLAELRDALAPYVAAPRVPADPRQLLDVDRLRALEDQLGDSGFVREAVQTYLEELPGRVAAIRESYAGGRREELVRMSHTLKSSSSMLGALALSEHCAGIESMALTGGADGLGRAVEEVPELQEQTAAALLAWSRGGRPG